MTDETLMIDAEDGTQIMIDAEDGTQIMIDAEDGTQIMLGDKTVTLTKGKYVIQGTAGTGIAHSITQVAEINQAIAAKQAPPLYAVQVGLSDDLMATVCQPAEPPKPPTPKQRITAPSVPLSVRRKELARKMRAKR